MTTETEFAKTFEEGVTPDATQEAAAQVADASATPRADAAEQNVADFADAFNTDAADGGQEKSE